MQFIATEGIFEAEDSAQCLPGAAAPSARCASFYLNELESLDGAFSIKPNNNLNINPIPDI